jgi:hypothetical protein
MQGTCGEDDHKNWAMYKGDAAYNIKNPCCRKLNQGSWGALIPTVQAQATLLHLFSPAGRVYYAKYMALLAAAVADYPAAIGAYFLCLLCSALFRKRVDALNASAQYVPPRLLLNFVPVTTFFNDRHRTDERTAGRGAGCHVRHVASLL